MMTDAAYPPLNVPKQLADGVWTVDAAPIRAMGVLVLPLRMTIFKLRDGGLLLFSPTRFRESLRAKIETFGPIRHLVAPSTGHWMFVREWQQQCPQAKTWAVPELAERKVVRDSGLRFDGLLGEEPPGDWAGEFEHVLFRGPGYGEADMFHKASGTLVVADTILDVRAPTLPPLSRGLALGAGICKPGGRAPLQLRALLSTRREANAAAARRLVSLAPDRVVVAHGDIIEHDVRERLRSSLEWLEAGRGIATGLTAIGIATAATALFLATRRPPQRRRVSRR